MSKIHLHLRLVLEVPMLPHLLTLVAHEGAAQLSGQRVDFSCEGPPHGGRILGLQRDQERKPGGAFYQRSQCRHVNMADKQAALQWPGTVRSTTSAGRSSMLMMSWTGAMRVGPCGADERGGAVADTGRVRA